jgi:hypothetical protein
MSGYQPKCDHKSWEMSGNANSQLTLAMMPCGQLAVHFYMSRINNQMLYSRCEEHVHESTESDAFIWLTADEFCCREVMTS